MARNKIVLDIVIPDYEIVCAQLTRVRTLCDGIKKSLEEIRQGFIETNNALRNFLDSVQEIQKTKNKSKGRKHGTDKNCDWRDADKSRASFIRVRA